MEANSRVVEAGVGFGAGFGLRSDRPALVEWRLDAGVLPLRGEPDRPACRRLAGRIGCVSSSRPPRAERNGADATRCTDRCRDDGGAVTDRPALCVVPKIAGIASAKPMAPVISAATRTRAHFSLMFDPYVVDISARVSALGGNGLKGSLG